MRVDGFRPGRLINPRRSFATRLALAMAVLVALGVAAATFVTSEVVRSTVTDRTGENFQAQAESLNKLVALYLLEKVTELQVVASSDAIEEAVAARNTSYAAPPEQIQEEIQALDARWAGAADDDPLILSVTSTDKAINPASHELASFLDSFEAHSEVFVTDRYGATVGATGVLSDYYQADESWWAASWNGGEGAVFISDPEFDESAGIAALLIAAPVVSDETGEVIGVIRSTLDVAELRDLIEGVSIGDTGHALLLSASGEALFDGSAGSEGEKNALPSELEAPSGHQGAGFVAASGTLLGYANLDDIPRQSQGTAAGHGQAMDAVAGLGWTVVVRQDSSEALSSVNMIVRGGIVAGIVAVILAAAIALLLARAMTRPLVDLSRAAGQIGVGNLEALLPKPGNDEVGQLTTSFGYMAGRLRNLIDSLKARSAEVSRANEELQGEIAERKRAEAALRESEAKYRHIFENVQDIYFHTEPTGTILELSPAVERFGYTREQLIGTSVLDIYENPDERAAFVDELLKSGEVIDYELHLKAGDGRVVPSSASAFIRRDSDGTPIGIEGTLRDITERKQAEQALRESEQRLRTVVASAPIVLSAMDRDGVFTLSEGKGLEALRHKPGQVVGQSVFDVFREVPAVLRDVRRALDGETFTSTVDIGRLTYETHYMPVADHQGEVAGVIGVAMDITERRRAEEALGESEQRHRTLLENYVDGVSLIIDGKIAYVNPRLTDMIGYTLEELRDLSPSDLVLQEEQAEPAARPGAALEGDFALAAEHKVIKKDGSLLPVEVSARLVQLAGKTAVLAVVRDITERKRAEEALRESEAKYRRIFENVQDIYFHTEPTGTIIELSPAVERFGYTREQLAGTSVLDIYEDPDERTAFVQALLEDGEVLDYELHLKAGDGRVVPTSTSAFIRRGPDGTPVAIEGTLRDITERKRAEEALQASESKFRTMAETLAAAAFIWQGERLRYVNPAAESMTGYSRGELLAMNFWDMIHPDLQESVKQQGMARQHGADLPSRYELMIVTKAGDTRWVEFTGGTIEYEGRPAAIGTSFDITERKQAEKALRQSESKFRTMAETLAAAAFIFQGYAIRYANAAAETITGYTREELLSVNLWDIIHADSQDMVRRRREGRRQGQQAPMSYEVKIVTKGGEEKWVHFTGGPIEFEGREAVMGTAFDITERKQAEESLREQARRDPLTGTLNHAAIVDELRSIVADGNDTCHHCVAMVDVDGLKAVNDTYGHQVGDALLVATAGVLSRDGAVVGRYGGDEFVVILPQADRHAAEHYRTDVTAALRAASVTDPQSGATISAAISIGLAVYPDEADTVAELIQLSDSAMYAAKRQRPIVPDGLTTARPEYEDRAAEMVGHIVPFLTSPAQLDDRIKLVAQRISVAAGYDAVNIDIFSQRTGPPNTRNVFAEVSQEVIKAWRGDQRPVEEDPFIQLVLRTRRGITVDDPQNDERLTENQRNALRAAQLRSAAVVPLFWEDELIGVLSVASKREGAITARDVQFLTTVATQVSAIVRMATLVDQLQSTSSRLAQAQGDTVLLLAAAAEAHDLATGLHLQGVRALTQALARELGYSEDDAHALSLAAVLHDIGKIRVPDSVLASPGPLPDGDWELMKQHTVWGAEFLADRPGFELASEIALCHHERWDGTGYPRGLSGEAIPEAATIVTVADSFDAMTHDRPYRARRSTDQAVQEILAYSGRQFSPKVVAALKRLFERGALVPALKSAPNEQAAA